MPDKTALEPLFAKHGFPRILTVLQGTGRHLNPCMRKMNMVKHKQSSLASNIGCYFLIFLNHPLEIPGWIT